MMPERRTSVDVRVPSYLQLVLNRVMAEHLSQTIGDFTRLGINIQTCRVLLSLHHHQQLRPSTLCYLVGMEQSAISHLLKSLTRHGLVARERDKTDNRAVDVRLTTKGKQLAAQCHRIALKQERLLLAKLSSRETEALRKLVWKIDKSVRGRQFERLSQRPTGEGTKIAAQRRR